MALELGGWIGGFFPEDDHEYYDQTQFGHRELRDANMDVGLRLGFYPLAMVGLEGEAGWIIASTDETERRVNLFSLRGQLVVQMPARITPFVLAGIENVYVRESLGEDRDTDWFGGVGLKAYLNNRAHLRLDGRVHRANRRTDGETDNGDVNHYRATLGLAIDLGAKSSGPARPADRDGDGIVDGDECPDEAGPAPTGCPVRDTDGDGIMDDADQCPEQAETVNQHEDTDGCPDELPDPDGDGIRGAADTCPDQPEDMDSFQDDDGCPDADNDADGLADTVDACPGEAGPAENKGCPDKDRDGDTVVDRLDNCPDEAGTPENQGCKAKQLVVITRDQLKILDKVYFRTGKAVLDRKSNALLDNVAQVLNAHPEIERVRIEGHTDDQGPDAKNKTLSQARAEAVVTYLTGKGVAAERLEAVGFGEEKPIADNKTRAGKAANRRVEFNIVTDAGTAAPAPADKPADKPSGDGTMKPEF